MSEQLLIGICFALVISVSSYLARFLTLDGSLAQFVLGVILLGFGGWQWTVPMLVFFLLSSLISKSGKRKRAAAESFFEKTSRRDAFQVAANGGVAGLLTLLWLFTRYDVLYAAFLGSIAASTADTWGTEIGTLSTTSPVLITTFKKVEAGRSGAVSLFGLLAGFAGAGTIWLSGLPWFGHGNIPGSLIAVMAGGMSGSLADSFAGAKFQAQYRCRICGKLTESNTHCNEMTGFESGFRWVRNDQVNAACSVVGAVVSVTLYELTR